MFRRTRGVRVTVSQKAARSDELLRQQISELAEQLRSARIRPARKQSHKLRNTLLIAAGVGIAAAAAPSLWKAASKRRRGDEWAPGEGSPSNPLPATVDAEIEVGVPVSTAYNQWTQFEEFPRFMEGVDEVKQLDDTLLHWAATVAGKHAEWDAKIIEQEPDRRITWESTDGKRTRGTVTFEQAGPDRSRIRLRMSYLPEGAAEKAGSAMRLDSRRVRGDLERFRELIESRGVASGAWRGEIKEGAETGSS